MSKRLLIALAACLLMLGGCNLIYKQNIQQGNAIEQEDLEQLRLGMSQNQVAFLLGTPSIRDPFHRDRWDYVSSFSRRGGEPVKRIVTLVFEDGALVEMLGVEDQAPTEEGRSGAPLPAVAAAVTEEDSVAVEAVAEAPEEAAVSAAATADETVESTAAAATDTVAEAAGSAAVVTAIDTPVAADAEFAEATASEAMEATGADREEAADAAVAEAVEAAPQDPALTGELPGLWIVQFGAFEARENAAKLVRVLDDSGVAAGVVTQQVQGLGERHLVRHGGLTSRAAAERLLERVRDELGVNGFVVPPS